MNTPLKIGDLVRCRDCGALWWCVESPKGVGLHVTLRTPYPCGPCCDNREAAVDLVCHDYDGHLFAAPDGVEWRKEARRDTPSDTKGLAERES